MGYVICLQSKNDSCQVMAHMFWIGSRIKSMQVMGHVVCLRSMNESCQVIVQWFKCFLLGVRIVHVSCGLDWE